jgi:hypothetical protein
MEHLITRMSPILGKDRKKKKITVQCLHPYGLGIRY